MNVEDYARKFNRIPDSRIKVKNERFQKKHRKRRDHARRYRMYP